MGGLVYTRPLDGVGIAMGTKYCVSWGEEVVVVEFEGMCKQAQGQKLRHEQ